MDRDLLCEAVCSSRDAMMMIEVDGTDHRLVFVNPAYEHMTGYTCDEMLGEDYRFLLGTDVEQSEIERIERAMVSGDPITATLRNYRKTGEVFWNHISLSPVRSEGGEVRHFIGIHRDVSKEHSIQAQLKKINKLYHSINEQLENENETDHLTGLKNRRYLERSVDLLLETAKRQRLSINVLLIDVDRFKEVNDTHGHEIGDYCLKQLSECLQDVFSRASDVVARYGGDEFVAISLSDDAEQIVERANILRERVKNFAYIPPGQKIDVTGTISVGVVSLVPEKTVTFDDLLCGADSAMYAAKRGGRNGVYVVNEVCTRHN